MPRAEARLLAREDLSRVGIREFAGNRDSRWASWVDVGFVVFPDSAAAC